MNSDDLAKAIKYLRPTAQFSFKEADYSTIVWDVLDGDEPTIEQLELASIEVKKAEEKAKAEAIAKREAAEAKLAALGLDSDDLKVLGII